MIEKILFRSKREVEGILSRLFGKEEKESHRDIIRKLPIKRVKIEQNVFTGESSPQASSLDPKAFTSESVQIACSSSPAVSVEKAILSEPLRSDESNRLPKPKGQAVRKIKIEFVAEEGLAEKIERAKEILRHKFPDGKFEDIFNQALDDLLEKRDPNKKTERIKKRKTIREKKILSRYISQEIKRKVWERDGGQCAYESQSGKRCEARGFLQFDHVQPWALWGETTEENLRLLCAQHNRWRAQSAFF